MEITVNNCPVLLGDLDSIISHKKKLSQRMYNLRSLLEDTEEDLERFKKYLYTHCHHNWITDSIDSMEGFKEGQLIKYCDICELSYKL